VQWTERGAVVALGLTSLPMRASLMFFITISRRQSSAEQGPAAALSERGPAPALLERSATKSGACMVMLAEI